MTNGKKRPSDIKEWLTLSFGYAEDVVYVGLGLLLMAVAAIAPPKAGLWRGCVN